jgi:aspartate-semialdehyde dehydrogenase
MPAIQVIQVPVFYCYAFTAYADFEAAPDISQIEAALTATGSVVEKEAEPAPDNINVAGESCIHFGPVEASAEAKGFWFWGAADNVRLAAMNAVLIAERLRAS